MERTLEMMKEIVFQFDGDLTAQVFGVEIEAQSIVDDYKWMIQKIELYTKALEEITRQYDYTTVDRAKEIANNALRELMTKHNNF